MSKKVDNAKHVDNLKGRYIIGCSIYIVGVYMAYILIQR